MEVAFDHKLTSKILSDIFEANFTKANPGKANLVIPFAIIKSSKCEN